MIQKAIINLGLQYCLNIFIILLIQIKHEHFNPQTVSIQMFNIGYLHILSLHYKWTTYSCCNVGKIHAYSCVGYIV